MQSQSQSSVINIPRGRTLTAPMPSMATVARPAATTAAKPSTIPTSLPKSTQVTKPAAEVKRGPMSPSAKRSETEAKEACKRCNRDFYVSTLQKHDGYCGTCVNHKDKAYVPTAERQKAQGPKGNCLRCTRECYEETLAKHEGYCGICINHRDKPYNPKPKRAAPPKEACPGCGTDYTRRTLKNNNGICARCAKKEEAGEELPAQAAKSTSQSTTGRKVGKKDPCPICQDEFSPTTLKKYGGVCRKCANEGAQADA